MASGFKLGLGLSQRGGGVPFTPADLFAVSEEGVFYDVASETVAGSLDDESGNAVDLAQATEANQPTPGSESGSHFLTFDGADFLTASTTFTQTAGSVGIVFRLGDVVYQERRRCLLSFADTGTANNWLEIGVDTARRIYVEFNAAGTLTTWLSFSLVERETDHSLTLVYDGSDLFMVLDGAQEPIVEAHEGGAGGWFGDVTGGDTLTLGAANSSGGAARQFNGRIYSALIVETEVF